MSSKFFFEEEGEVLVFIVIIAVVVTFLVQFIPQSAGHKKVLK